MLLKLSLLKFFEIFEILSSTNICQKNIGWGKKYVELIHNNSILQWLNQNSGKWEMFTISKASNDSVALNVNENERYLSPFSIFCLSPYSKPKKMLNLLQKLFQRVTREVEDSEYLNYGLGT